MELTYTLSMAFRDDIMGMQEVRENLFFGDLMDACDHESYRRNGVDAVFNLCGIEPTVRYPDDVQFFDLELVDGETCRYENFHAAVDQVVEGVSQGWTVFVHCAAGNSRSVTVCAAAYAILEDTSFQEGLEEMRSLRSVSPEPTLLDYGEKSVAELQRYGDES